MITLTFDENKKRPMYEQLYAHIRHQIEDGILNSGQKLPSKRMLSAHLRVSQSTVENAYAQLEAEGYVEAFEKKGVFVCGGEYTARSTFSAPEWTYEEPKKNELPFDLSTNTVESAGFPFPAWSRLMREVLRDNPSDLLKPVHPQGDAALRDEIAAYLRGFRNMNISPGQIVLGAGSEYLLGLIAELLDLPVFALENPGYSKNCRILQSKRVTAIPIEMDGEGLQIDKLEASPAAVSYVTPSHHFPLGTVMSIRRRRQLLRWAEQDKDRFIIEDDYDSEYRFAGKPIPTLQSLDNGEKVIYLNTFAKTLSPSLRIGYMVLPRSLLARFREKLSFYSCSVSAFEQKTLCSFLNSGNYERHLNRMRTLYRNRRDALLRGLAPLGSILSVRGQEAGTHLLLKVSNGMNEQQLVKSAADKGVGVYPLSACFLTDSADRSTVIAGYAAHSIEDLLRASALLCESWNV